MGLRTINTRPRRVTLVGLICGAMTFSPCMPALAQQPVTNETFAPTPAPSQNMQQPVNLAAAPQKTQQPAKPRLSADVAGLRRNLVFDVALDANGSLFGEVRDAQGNAKRDADVGIWQGKQMIQRTKTNNRGQFYFANLKGGIYRIATKEVTLECRAWTAKLAPPNARESLLVVANMYSARGQQPINEVFCFNPFLMGTIVAAAIAIPIAIHDSGDGELADAVELPDGS